MADLIQFLGDTVISYGALGSEQRPLTIAEAMVPQPTNPILGQDSA